ncbi:MAG TPA: biotin--[acetyl-CoA-carboxylase] ligase [Wenzhouxiangellaceae bacterium]|nr:biotin--[acetyl-CoA-carboxylase] ligase [Wenzhouxiangellaceae bacterium]
MTPEAFRLFRALADGRPLDLTRYAAETGISPSEVPKQVEQLRCAGLPVAAVRGSGYCLAWPIRLLDAAEIHRAADSPDVTVDIVDRTDSTNRDLTEHFAHRRVRAAEYQSGGRGRRGRGWISPPGCGVYLSFGFKFECGLQRLGSLSLVAGIVAAEVVIGEGVPAALKWPNDLIVGGAKLGGLLIEIRGASEGPCEVVAGIGINVRLPRGETESCGFIAPDQPWTDIHTATPGRHDLGGSCNRSRLIGRLTGALDTAFAQFERAGFEPFMARWKELDALEGRNVRVAFGTGSVLEGVAAGVDAQGRLRVKYSGGIRSVNAGEVSVRAH